MRYSGHCGEVPCSHKGKLTPPSYVRFHPAANTVYLCYRQEEPKSYNQFFPPLRSFRRGRKISRAFLAVSLSCSYMHCEVCKLPVLAQGISLWWPGQSEFTGGLFLCACCKNSVLPLYQKTHRLLIPHFTPQERLFPGTRAPCSKAARALGHSEVRGRGAFPTAKGTGGCCAVESFPNSFKNLVQNIIRCIFMRNTMP